MQKLNLTTALQAPVVGKYFFDREEVMEKLMEVNQHIALIGQRKAGKTSCFSEFRRKQKKSIVSYFYVPFDVSLGVFCYGFFRSIVRAYLEFKEQEVSVQSLSLKTEFEELARHLSIVKPQLRSFLQELKALDVNSKDKTEVYGILRAFLDVPYKLREVSDPQIVVIIDEFQNGVMFHSGIADLLRQNIQEQKGVVYYVGGSEVSLIDDILNRQSAPLFGHFTTIRVGAFAYEDARQFALSLFMKQKMVINDGLLNTLVALSGGYPYVILILVVEILDVCQKSEDTFVTKESFETALERTLFYHDGKVYKYFEETLEVNLQRVKTNRFYQILEVIAQKPMGVTQLATTLGLKVTSLPQYLDTLLKTELISKQESEYVISDTLMQFWFNARLKIQQNPIVEMKEAVNSFHRQLGHFLNAMKSQLGIAREAQVRETFVLAYPHLRFWGGMIHGKEFDIIANDEGSYILGEIKSTVVNVQHVEVFLHKVDLLKKRESIAQLFFVQLMGIAPAAQKELEKNRVEVWDLQRINSLREKHKLPKIMM